MLVLPYVHYLHTQGALNATIGPHGSAPFYPFSPNHTEVAHKRHFCPGPEANRCAPAAAAAVPCLPRRLQCSTRQWHSEASCKPSTKPPSLQGGARGAGLL